MGDLYPGAQCKFARDKTLPPPACRSPANPNSSGISIFSAPGISFSLLVGALDAEHDLGGVSVRVGIATPNMILVRAMDTLSVLSPCIQNYCSTMDFMIYTYISVSAYDTCISLSFFRIYDVYDKASRLTNNGYWASQASCGFTLVLNF
jgi:hypothetical protein